MWVPTAYLKNLPAREPPESRRTGGEFWAGRRCKRRKRRAWLCCTPSTAGVWASESRRWSRIWTWEGTCGTALPAAAGLCSRPLASASATTRKLALTLNKIWGLYDESSSKPRRQSIVAVQRQKEKNENRRTHGSSAEVSLKRKDCHTKRYRRRGYPIVALLLGGEVSDASEEKSGSEDEEEVGKYWADEGAFHHFNFALVQSEKGDDQLRRVPAGRVQEASHCSSVRSAEIE